jgi:lipoprotein-anchoring transpeptidase ErfK/SrfK
MRFMAKIVTTIALLASFTTIAHARVVARIDKSEQQMRVYVDGELRYTWPVSTARPGYHTPTGSFGVQSMHRHHRSTIYSGAPMPHAIFFHGGYAIHGTYETRNLGRRASHGCVRLHPENARELFELVEEDGGRIIINN